MNAVATPSSPLRRLPSVVLGLVRIDARRPASWLVAAATLAVVTLAPASRPSAAAGGGVLLAMAAIGSLLRAPLSRLFAMEGTFTYLVPGQTRSIDITGSGVTSNFSPAAWNVGLNLVYYPAGRSRRGLASPYRPLFEVADNGSMIREFSLSRLTP